MMDCACLTDEHHCDQPILDGRLLTFCKMCGKTHYSVPPVSPSMPAPTVKTNVTVDDVIIDDDDE